MKRNMVWFLVILLMCLCSCGLDNTYSFMNPEKEIDYITIATITIDENKELQQTEGKAISDINGFLKDFRCMRCDSWWGDPIGITEDCYAIKVVYQNGEYELIAWNGKAEYREDSGFRNYRGYHMFDEDEFQRIISAYQ